MGVDPPPREWSDESSGADDDHGEGEVAEDNAAAAVNKRTVPRHHLFDRVHSTPAGRSMMS